MSDHNTLIFKPSDITVIDGQPRVLDLRLAEALEFERPRTIRDLIKRHMSTLESLGTICRTARQIPNVAGRPATEYHLNEEQAVFLCAKSETPKATAVTIEVVKTFVAHKNGITQVKAHTRRLKAPPMDQVVEALGNADLTPRQLLRKQLEKHARAIFTLMRDSAPEGLDRVENVYMYERAGQVAVGGCGFTTAKHQHGDTYVAFTPDYRWKIVDGKHSGANSPIPLIEKNNRKKGGA